MRKVLFFRGFRGNVKTVMVNLACIVMIALLAGACAGTNKMQTAQASAKGGSESEIIGDQTIECRRKATTGSRFKKKVCKTKAQWAREAGSGNKNAEDLQKGVDRSYSTNPGSPAGPMGGMTSGVPR